MTKLLAITPNREVTKPKRKQRNSPRQSPLSKMAHKSMEMSTKLTDEVKEKALSMIAELESMIESGDAPSEGKVKKLNDLF